jgi:hypothetical protein
LDDEDLPPSTRAPQRGAGAMTPTSHVEVSAAAVGFGHLRRRLFLR